MKKITMIAAMILAAQQLSAQDSCASPTVLPGAGLYTVTAVNGMEAPSPVCTENGVIANNARGEWFSYTPAQNYTLTVSTNISQNTPRVDTRFHVYTGSCGSLVCYNGDDDSGSNFSSQATFPVYGGTTYIIAFDNRWTSNGFTFQLTESTFVEPIPNPVDFVPQNLATINTGGYNMCTVDMNNDYLDDIVGVSATNIRVNYQNPDGTFSFTDYPTASAEHVPSWSIAAGDYNADGYNDLLYGSGSGLTLMRSNGLGTGYSKDTPGQYIFCQRTNFVDINNDGNLDAFSCHDVDPNVYYINDGNANMTYYQSGTTPGAYMLGITPSGGNYASLWTDYDNDGDLDLFISKCSGPPCEMHRNDRNGVFTDVSAQLGVNMTPITSWSSAVFDYDNDGDMDILIGRNGSVGHKFLRNNLDTSNNTEEAFTEVTAGSGWDTQTSNNRDYIAYDFDNDGWVDVMGGGGRIMFNKGDGTFAPVTYANLNMGAVGDFNNDGFLDIQNGTNLFINQGNDNKWIRINLQGVQSNRNGIGARVEIHGSFGKQIREVRSGEGFGFMSTLSVHFGIGQASAIEKLVIKWPSGTEDTILNPAVNASTFVMEGSTLAVNKNETAVFSIYPNPASDVLHISSKNRDMQSAQVYDLNGRVLVNTSVVNQSVDVRGLASGTYLLLLKDAQGQQHSQKFIKK